MLNKIEELRQTRKEKQRIEEKEKALSSPILTNLSFMPQILEIYEQISAAHGHPGVMESVYERKKFLFIVLFLYSPGALLGGRMPRGLRSKLAYTLKCHGTVVSDNCAGLLFMYEWYKDFREETDSIYREIRLFFTF
jgi:hypothetical protein